MMFWPLSQERYAARTQSTGLILQPFDAHPARQWVEEQLTPICTCSHPSIVAISGRQSESVIIVRWRPSLVLPGSARAVEPTEQLVIERSLFTRYSLA